MQLSASHDTKTYYRLRKLEMTDIQEQQTTAETPDSVEDIRLDLIEDLTETQKWRERKFTEYPTDDRNLRAVPVISQLLETTQDISPALLHRFGAVLDAELTDENWDHFLRALGAKDKLLPQFLFIQSIVSRPGDKGMVRDLVTYRLNAAHCLEITKEFPKPTDKLALLDMAQASLRLCKINERFGNVLKEVKPT
jgi:hypothetical protein